MIGSHLANFGKAEAGEGVTPEKFVLAAVHVLREAKWAEGGEKAKAVPPAQQASVVRAAMGSAGRRG